MSPPGRRAVPGRRPIDGLSFRAVTSRDIRAPNLSELFAAPVVTNTTVLFKGSPFNVLGETVGNPALKPEIARNTTFGMTLAQPQFLPGFSASIDYYDIRVNNEIAALTAQQEADLCAGGNQQLCSQMLLTSPTPNTNYIRVQSFNLAKVRDEGVDIEVMYRTGLSALRLPGAVDSACLGDPHHQLPDRLRPAQLDSHSERGSQSGQCRHLEQRPVLEGRVHPRLGRRKVRPDASPSVGSAMVFTLGNTSSVRRIVRSRPSIIRPLTTMS